MDSTVQVAAIVAISTLSASLIPAIVNYFNNNVQRKFELDKILFEKKHKAYIDAMNALQEMVNADATTLNARILEFQKPLMEVSLYGDDKAAKGLNEYFRELVRSNNNERLLLSKEEHQKYHKNAINGMRTSMGNKKLKHFEIISLRLDGK
ncbi:MAG: hypothetical protein HOC94_06310 [Waddliaceae bacterium]|jgi:hypothetical protein|nr:hypothetical protein [Waddliaceae bacterium]